jgi:hypothetical protein
LEGSPLLEVIDWVWVVQPDADAVIDVAEVGNEGVGKKRFNVQFMDTEV